MRKKLITGAAGLVLASGIGLGMTQLAQAETPTPTTSPTATATPGDITAPTHEHGEGRGQGGRGLDAAALATKLGLPEATVSDALSAVHEARSATSSAKPTDKDATRGARQEALAKALATELNIDEAKVTKALTELRAEAKAAVTDAEKATLERAVTDGKLTQTEADAVQKAIDGGIVSTRGGGHGRR